MLSKNKLGFKMLGRVTADPERKTTNNGKDYVSLSLRVSFAEVAKPLLEDGRFLQPHRSYVVNLAAAQLLTAGELQMCSGARIPIPRGREGAVREAFRSWIDR